MNEISVGLISHEFPPFAIGGIATNCHDLAHNLSKKKIQTTVFCGKSKKLRINRLSDYLTIVRLPCFDFPPRYLWFQLQNFKTISQLTRDCTILHGVNPISSAICTHIKKRLRVPFVITHHDHHLKAMKVFIDSPFSEWTIGDFNIYVTSYPLQDATIKKCLGSSDHVIVPGNYTLRYMKTVYAGLDTNKVSVIYNAIDFDKIKNSGESLPQENPSILYFGQLVSRKGILYLLKAMTFLKKDYPKVNLEICGRGPLEKKIRRLIIDLHLQKHVHLRGYAEYRSLIAKIKTADVVVLPSTHEVGPFIAALETMACKKPVVAFDMPFTREFIFNMKNGILARAGSVEDLYDKIRLLLSDKKLRHRLGENAYNHVIKEHNWDTAIEKYVRIYENCLSK